MKSLVFIPVLVILFILQVSLFSRLPLLYGSADLILLALAAWSLNERVKFSILWALGSGAVIGVVSATPDFVPLVGYAGVVIFGRLLLRRVWQAPIIAMFITVFLGTFLLNSLSFLMLQFEGVNITLLDSINLVVLPSALINLFLSLPMFSLVRDFVQWVYPIDIEL
jgi:rod shape-determining protein MreD